MSQPLALTPPYRLSGPEVELLAQAKDLGLALRLVGKTQAAVVPQRVGDWYLEPLTPERLQELPLRARARLSTVLGRLIPPEEVKAIVLFHEIPGQMHPRPPLARAASRALLWAQQELPVQAHRAAQAGAAFLVRTGEAGKKYGPTVGKFLLVAAAVTATGAGMVLLAALMAAATTVSVVDPCLVVVTKEGHWYEVDRWYD